MIENHHNKTEEVIKILGKIIHHKIFLTQYFIVNNQEAVEDVLKIILDSVEKIELLLKITDTTKDEKHEGTAISVLDLLERINELKQLKKYLENSKNMKLPEESWDYILKSTSTLRDITDQILAENHQENL